MQWNSLQKTEGLQQAVGNVGGTDAVPGVRSTFPCRAPVVPEFRLSSGNSRESRRLFNALLNKKKKEILANSSEAVCGIYHLMQELGKNVGV